MGGGEIVKVTPPGGCSANAETDSNTDAGTQITDAGLAHLSGIDTLDISYCNQITDAGLAHLLGIHTLDVSWCNQITDAGLAHLSGIHTLEVTNCNQITDAGLANLRDANPSVCIYR